MDSDCLIAVKPVPIQRSMLRLKLPTAFQSLGHRHLVGVFDVASGRDTGSDARKLHWQALEHARDIGGGGFALNGRIRCNDELVDLTAIDVEPGPRDPTR